jgi:hypothetical protein
MEHLLSGAMPTPYAQNFVSLVGAWVLRKLCGHFIDTYTREKACTAEQRSLAIAGSVARKYRSQERVAVVRGREVRHT